MGDLCVKSGINLFLFAHLTSVCIIYLCPPLKKEGILCCICRSVGRSVRPSVGRSVGMSVSLNLVQLITQEGFSPEASNLLVRKSLMSR